MLYIRSKRIYCTLSFLCITNIYYNIMDKKSYILASKIAKTLLNVASAKEKADVTDWANENSSNKECINNLKDSTSIKNLHDSKIEAESEQAWKEIQFKLINYQRPRRRIYVNKQNNNARIDSALYKYVAVTLIAFLLGLSLYKITNTSNNININSVNEGAYMVLANGELIDLKSKDACKSKDYIINNNDSLNTVYYNFANNKSAVNSNRYNVIKTEKGNSYSIYLPDNTLAHLSSGSMLKFPEQFDKNTRVVEISGEVFFEVSHGNPFIVKTADVEIQVLGTTFNVCAYEDSEVITATLVQGAIKMKKGDYEVLLKPNQKAIAIRNTDKIDVQQVDAEQESAWINGNFSFRNERLEDVLKSLRRWYDFNYVFLDADCEDIPLGLNLERNVEFSKIVEILTRAELFDIKVSGNKIIIKKKQRH